MNERRIVGYKKIQGIITVITGLHIGGTTNTVEIAGMDNPIILNPVTKEPFIPGSSLKGKMRSLLEWNLGKIPAKGDPYPFNEKDSDGHPISRIFGTSADSAKIGPTRLVVRDAFVSTAFKSRMREQDPTWAYMDMREEKTENAINRITARANPRFLERVVPGVEFEFEMIYKVFDLGDGTELDERFFNHVLTAMKLLEQDALGGSGSRGCGKIDFKIRTGENLLPLTEVNSEMIKTVEFSEVA